ncbi:PEGA domain-containing protein [Candidatus Microgenomates bacterium]|nr:MAG: PEGA domain-containing protein [Candidatus Microgenomates bacterium]
MTRLRLVVLMSTFLVLATFGLVAILVARGYRLEKNMDSIGLAPSGILVVNSDPNGAQVYINGNLETATNNTINLKPETYEVQIKKEGYLSWSKTLVIKKEEVTQVDAFLLPVAPSLTALTFSGAISPQVSEDLTKIAYAVPLNSDNAEKAGLWVFETVNLPLGFNRDPRQITDGDLGEAQWEWSPSGREILLTTKAGVFLLDTSKFTSQNQRVNVASRLNEIGEQWADEQDKRLEARLNKLPEELRGFFKAKTAEVRFAPDESKVLYEASSSGTIPSDVIRPLPGASTQAEEREIVPGKSYVFDLKEDKNFLVANAGNSIEWLPNSLNLIIPQENKIEVVEYDGTNKQTVYSGNYLFPNAYPSSSSGRVLILTNFGSEATVPNLYWLSLK